MNSFCVILGFVGWDLTQSLQAKFTVCGRETDALGRRMCNEDETVLKEVPRWRQIFWVSNPLHCFPYHFLLCFQWNLPRNIFLPFETTAINILGIMVAKLSSQFHPAAQKQLKKSKYFKCHIMDRKINVLIK